MKEPQGGQPPPMFGYDGLSRLTSATNPESGTVGYVYNADGNLTQKTDNRNVQINYTYDALNRVMTRSYMNPSSNPNVADPTPTVTYGYDGQNCMGCQSETVNNSTGRLTFVQSSVSTETIDNYDSLGRVLQSTQITGGQPYVMNYTYNLAGDIMTEKYPSGRVVTSAYDGAGRLNSLTGTPPGSSSSKNYATQFTYTAPGGVASLNLGNNLWEHTTFNSRLQPMQMGLGTSSTDSSIFGLLYGFGTTNNNGNVLSEAITPASGTTFNQTFTYDQVNRLQTATETNGSATNWSRTFSYDVFGNMWVSASGGTASMPLNPLTPTAQSAYSAANDNQLVASTYDAAGNQSVDGQGGLYFYDGDNMMTRCTVNGVSSSYQYDGNGRRIAKTVGGLTTTFVYNSGGALVAEYGAEPTTPNTGTSYLTTDHLGSTRVVTNNSQAVVSRHDYLPFGEEITLLAGGRTGTVTGGLNYQGPDDTRQKFTSKERDTESNLDFFEVRYFSAFQGRFTSPDEFTGGPEELFALAAIGGASNPTFYADTANPQSLNKYEYCHNNPLRFIDPTGHSWGDFSMRGLQGAVIHAAQVLHHDGRIRAEYNSRKVGMNSAQRDALKIEMRQKSTPLGRTLAEGAAKDPGRVSARAAKTAEELALSVERTNPTWNKIGKMSEGAGKVMLGLGVAISAYNIATAPEGQKGTAVAQEAGAWAGATTFGSAGAELGGAIGGPPGAAIGGLVLGGVGAAAGSKWGKNGFPLPHSSVGPQECPTCEHERVH